MMDEPRGWGDTLPDAIKAFLAVDDAKLQKLASGRHERTTDTTPSDKDNNFILAPPAGPVAT